MCPELERVAGSRDRHSCQGRENQTLRKGGRDDKRHVNPTTLVPGMYHVIAPSSTGPLPCPLYPLSLFISFFVGIVARRFHPSLSLRRAIVYAASLQLRHSWLVRGECRHRDVATIDFGTQSGHLIFMQQPLRVVTTRLSCRGK